MEPTTEHFDVHSNPETFKDYMESFDVSNITGENVNNDKISAHFSTLLEEDYNFLNSLTFPYVPFSRHYATLKELLQ
ncbi:unnamed protein product [Schistosoma curassoni]|uniref:ARF-like 2-binding protein n=1 Tax=Schistosoma curassoni TaxID=6186 RepID=A0A183L7A2_9TREM|nr:unnamed protein product [Schistosoma curassoni]